jgi:hypothetical protein
MPSLDLVQEAPFTAQGVDSSVVVHPDKVVVKTRGMGSILKRAISTVTDPSSLIDAIQGPSKEVLLRALVDSTDLVHAILSSVDLDLKVPSGLGQEDRRGAIADQLKQALERNKGAFVDALKQNQGPIRDWAVEHKDLMGILIKGDIHIAIDTIFTVDLSTRRDGAGVLRLEFDAERVAVTFSAAHADEFAQVKALIDGEIGTGEVFEELPIISETKTCPMCAEEVKQAARICRFCSYSFEEAVVQA